MIRGNMHQMFIGGAWVDAGEAAALEVTNPATLAPLDSVPDCGPGAVHRAVEAAQGALPSWSASSAGERQALLAAIAARIRARARDIAERSTRESGRPACESFDAAAAAADIFERCATDPAPREIPAVVASLAPFDHPLPVTAAAVGTALAAGHTVVCKPPASSPLATLELAASFEILPRGVINVITGGARTGGCLLAHPGVSEVRWTGSASTARQIEAAGSGKRLDLQERTVGSIIVCRDADLDRTVPAVVWMRLACGGQAAASHVYVERPIAAELIDRLHPGVGFLDVDDPAKPSTDLGPLISAQAARRVEDQVGRTLRAGARLILGGRRFRPSGLPGHFFQPTLLADVPPGSVPAREEILGPVVTVTPVADLAEALRLAAASGGGTSIFAEDTPAVMQALRAAEGGPFRINDPPVEGLGPFGASTHRGLRLLLGPRDRAAALARVACASSVERKAWWFPYIERRVPPESAVSR